jgi:N-glycosylase/DNA lyase
VFKTEYFNPTDTLECGQVFRFNRCENGYFIHALDKCAKIYVDGPNTVVLCNDKDEDFFTDYFDLKRDYKAINDSALNSGYPVLTRSAKVGKGIRILNQNKTETLFSFIISQNNNIPRIKGIIDRLCKAIGERKNFDGHEYYAFPTVQKMSQMPLEFYKSIGLGYRAEYVKKLADDIAQGLDINAFSELDTNALKTRLIQLYGVGPKVCDCVLLFGFHRSDAFPVDTWIAKVYEQDFGGALKDRKKISEWFVNSYGEKAGYFQQYLFYYKRSLEG